MSYQLYASDECPECDDYVKNISDSISWKCEICQMTETVSVPWHRYEVACGHQVHIRCYRTWCHTQQMVGCPTCGLLDKKEDHMYCSYCGKFAHRYLDCLYD